MKAMTAKSLFSHAGCRLGALVAGLLIAVMAWAPARADDRLPTVGAAVVEKYFSFGDDSGEWAHDGECDDPRFHGRGMGDYPSSTETDASDCRDALAKGTVAVRPVFLPAYAAGAPYDSSEIDFGDNASQWANDGECDDPRFVGPNVALTLLDDDLKADADDCRAAFEAGKAALREDADRIELRETASDRRTI